MEPSLELEYLVPTEPAHSNVPAPEPSHGRSFFWAWVLSLTCFLYVAGLGPAVRIHRKVPSARAAIETIYAPLEALVKYCAPAKDILDWYVQFWEP